MSLFERVFFEAPEDDPPDMAPPSTDDAPPDIGGADDPPPDMDAGDMEGDMGDDNYGFDDGTGGDEDDTENLNFDDKISIIMNQRLYERFIKLHMTLKNQLKIFNKNMDLIDTISDKNDSILTSMTKLSENVEEYMANYFMNENYSKNLLFFNKCINLYNLLQQNFDKEIKRYVANEK